MIRRTLTFIVLMAMSFINIIAGDVASGETVITNYAEATYSDENGARLATVSPVVTVTVRPVAALTVTPDEDAPSASIVARETATRRFSICNTGNTADLYTLTDFKVSSPASLVGLYFDVDDSHTLTDADAPAQLNSSISPRVKPASCIDVFALINTNDVIEGATLQLELTARSNVEAIKVRGEDTGRIINIAGRAAAITAPTDARLQPVKLVENEARIIAAQNQVVTYAILFRNSGDAPARNVSVKDNLPATLDYVAGSLTLTRTPQNSTANTVRLTDAQDADEATARDHNLQITLAEVAPAEVIRLTFQVRINDDAPAAAQIENTATIIAANAAPVITSPAVVRINPAGIVFAARGNAAVQNAQLVLTDATGAPVTLDSATAAAPNARYENPFSTDASGAWNFAPALNVNPVSPIIYRLSVTAPNFRTRLIEIRLTPDAFVSNGLVENPNRTFALTLRALDNQPLAQASSFTLTDGELTLEHLTALAFNIPLFENSPLELSKSVDKHQAFIGDTLTYRLTLSNRTSSSLTDSEIRDTLPRGFHYAEGTAQIENAGRSSSAAAIRITPRINGRELTFNFSSLEAQTAVVITYRARIGADAGEGANINTAVASATFADGEAAITNPATATVEISRGVFSARQIIIGRVFEDANLNGIFDKGDMPVPDIRIYLNNGQSVITDLQGMYNFPAVQEGALAVSIDPVTLPREARLFDDAGLRDRTTWTRLLRTPLGGGGLLRQNFALRAARGASSLASTNAFVTPDKTAARTEASKRDLPNTNSAVADYKAEVANPDSASNTTSDFDKTLTARPPVSSVTQPGSYETMATEELEAVAPGDVQVISPRPEAFIIAPALTIETRVAENWTAELAVNNKIVSPDNIGLRRVDRKNRIATFQFVGISLQPGANRISVTAISPDHRTRGRETSFTIYGRGRARRIEIQPERAELRADNRDSSLIRVKLYDERGNPALDETVAIETSAGRLLTVNQNSDSEASNALSNIASPSSTSGTSSSETVSPLNADNQTSTATAARQAVIQMINGEALVRLVADSAPQKVTLRAMAGSNLNAQTELRFSPDVRPTILVGLAEISVGRAAPSQLSRGTNKLVSSQLGLFFKGKFFSDKNLLTLAYDSSRPINRTTGANNRDRLFALDSLERAYPLFGDSSIRYDEAQSNSKLYARLDRGRSFALFGDFDTATIEAQDYTAPTDFNSNFTNSNALTNRTSNAAARLALYQRRLTGVQLHLESSRGDFVTLSGARPDTAWAREIFGGNSLSLLRLAHAEILLGSEIVALESRDRRNPEIIVRRETLARSVDYNLDPLTGTIFLLRPLNAFDSLLNLTQIVVTYEHAADDFSSQVFTARAESRSGILTRLGVRAGASFAYERRPREFGSYALGGVDFERSLPRNGLLRFEIAMTRGSLDFGNGGVNNFSSANNFSAVGTDALTTRALDGSGQEANGQAFHIELFQPLPFLQATLRADYARTSRNFFNPFGATQTNGAQRATIALDLKPRNTSALRFQLSNERNDTENADNSRTTASVLYTEQLGEKLRVGIGYDLRKLDDKTNAREVVSNLVTVGAEYHPSDKLEISVKREQNLTDSDPTYPNATTLAARYALNERARFFFTQRLASAPTLPLADTTGFAATGARRETAFGIESNFGRAGVLNGRYQIENGINGTDSFAVIGLTNRFNLTKEFSLDAAFERGFHVKGNGESFTGGSLGFSWLPTENFRASSRYELRHRAGFGQIFTIGAAGKITRSLTTLARFQFADLNNSRAAFLNDTANGASTDSTNITNRNSSTIVTAALAYRPLTNDRAALLFNFTHRALNSQNNFNSSTALPVRDVSETLSADGIYQLAARTELYGRFALRHTGDGGINNQPYIATWTYLAQARVAQRLDSRLDFALEARTLFQPATSSRSTAYAAELGYWVMPDLRVGLGYNFTNATNSVKNTDLFNARRGFYLVLSSKMWNLFNLFGTQSNAATNANEMKDTATASVNTAKRKDDE